MSSDTFYLVDKNDLDDLADSIKKQSFLAPTQLTYPQDFVSTISSGFFMPAGKKYKILIGSVTLSGDTCTIPAAANPTITPKGFILIQQRASATAPAGAVTSVVSLSCVQNSSSNNYIFGNMIHYTTKSSSSDYQLGTPRIFDTEFNSVSMTATDSNDVTVNNSIIKKLTGYVQSDNSIQLSFPSSSNYRFYGTYVYMIWGE